MLYAEAERPRHPFTEATRRIAVYDDAFDERRVRRAIAAYFGMVSFLDDNIGKLLLALEQTGLSGETRVIYTSDHGDNLGARGLWGKSNMYEDAAGVPLLMAGPGVAEGFVCREPVSLVDGFPTILDCVGVRRGAADADLPGASLFDVVRGHIGPRTVFSEYHASGSVTGAFMIRRGRYKFVYYAGMDPQLFDVVADPWETRDLAPDPAWAGLRAACEADLKGSHRPRGDRCARPPRPTGPHRGVRRPRGGDSARHVRPFPPAGETPVFT